MDRNEIFRLGTQEGGDACTVLGHVGRRVVRARTAIERGIKAVRDAAEAREKAMGHAIDGGKVRRPQNHLFFCHHGTRSLAPKFLRTAAAEQAHGSLARMS